MDNSGDAYITGGMGVYVTKVNATGTALDWITNLGSTGVGTSIALDASGNIYVAGVSGNVPTTANALSTTTGTDFFCVLTPDGSGLLYSTALPGCTLGTFGLGGVPYQAALAIAPSGTGSLDNAYLTGEAETGLLTTAGAFQPNSGGGIDAFFTEINPNLSGAASLVYSSYLGGSGNDVGSGIAVDASGNAYLTGATYSTNFPTTSGAFQQTSGGSEDVFVAKFNPALSGTASLVYATYLGGNGFDGYYTDDPGQSDEPVEPGPAIAVDSAGDAYVAGTTTSTNFPKTPGAFQTTYEAQYPNLAVGDAFVTKLNPTGTQLVYSTYLGNENTGAFGIALDASDNAYVTGWTRSTSFPTVNPIQATKGSGGGLKGFPVSNVFVTTLNNSGTGLLFSTYLGGSGNGSSGDVFGHAIAVNSTGDIYVTGKTSAPGESQSTSFPTTAGAFDTTPGGSFVFMITPVVSFGPSFAITGPTTLTAGTTGTFTLTALNPNGTADTSYSGIVQVTSNDGKAVLPSDLAISDGTGTFNVTLETAGTQSVVATDVNTPSITGDDTGITVTPAAASTLEVSGFPSPTNVGLAGTVTITALDPYGNVATGYTGTVTLTNGAANVTSTIGSFAFATADGGVLTPGVLTASVALPDAGTSETLTATDTTTPTLTGTQSGITVDPAGVAASFSVTGFPTTTTAGVAQTITVTALTASGAVAGSYRGTEQFSSSDPHAGLPADYTFTNLDQGVYTFTVILEKAGTQSITVTDTVTSGITGSETGITVQAAAAAQFVLSGPATVTKGVAFSLVLTVEDTYGNVVTNFTGTVHFTSSDSTAVLPANYTFTASNAGTHTFTRVELKKTGTKTITVTDTTDSALTATESFDVLS